VDAYISTSRHRRTLPRPGAADPPPEPAVTAQQKMRAKVSSPEGLKIYRRRKCIPEPVFGQIKQGLGFRRFSMRGMEKAQGEWALVCTCHNIRKLWSARRADRLLPLA
jgi:Transposase DDE domain